MQTAVDATHLAIGTVGNQNHQSHGELLQLVSFHVGGDDFVEGVINLRGKVIPVIALRKRFGLEILAQDKQTRIVVVEVKGTVLGFMVDSVSEVLRIPADTVEPPPRLGKVEREYVSGVGKLNDRLLILLDVDRLMSESEESLAAGVGQA
jgi:purine-binding chemotaxis protein CheW